jgi:RNA polymerase sigma-70 factor (ECF subfamily)
MAEEIVQNVFCRIWEKRHQLKTDGSLKAYLYRAVHNESLNYLKHQKVKASFGVYYAGQLQQDEEENASGKLMTAELQQRIDTAMSELPQQCRIIFQLSRFEQLKYQQIADHMGLSVKTVENQMGKALRMMRQKLAEFLPVILIMLMQW